MLFHGFCNGNNRYSNTQDKYKKGYVSIRVNNLGRFFDPHIHMYSRTTNDYESMSKAGIEVIVQPSFWLGSPRTSVGTFEDYWEHMISFETQRSKEYGIDHYVCLSVNPKESTVRPLALNALEAMSKYIDRERVVAIGEIGYNVINELEDELFQLQLDIAVDKKMLTMIHLPHVNKKDGIERTKSVLKNKNLMDMTNKILIDHNTEETIEKTLELGCWAGLTVYPITKLSPSRAIDIIEKNGLDKIMINSSADWGVSDPLSVPLVAEEMKKRGFSINDIEKATFYNAFEFFKQSTKFKWRP